MFLFFIQENYKKFARTTTAAAPKDITFVSPATDNEEEIVKGTSTKRPLPPVNQSAKQQQHTEAFKKPREVTKRAESKPADLKPMLVKELSVVQNRDRSAKREMLKSTKVVVNENPTNKRFEPLHQKQMVMVNQVPMISSSRTNNVIITPNNVEQALSISEKRFSNKEAK